LLPKPRRSCITHTTACHFSKLKSYRWRDRHYYVITRWHHSLSNSIT